MRGEASLKSKDEIGAENHVFIIFKKKKIVYNFSQKARIKFFKLRLLEFTVLSIVGFNLFLLIFGFLMFSIFS